MLSYEIYYLINFFSLKKSAMKRGGPKQTIKHLWKAAHELKVKHQPAHNESAKYSFFSESGKSHTIEPASLRGEWCDKMSACAAILLKNSLPLLHFLQP